jgi:hypothetical protein
VCAIGMQAFSPSPRQPYESKGGEQDHHAGDENVGPRSPLEQRRITSKIAGVCSHDNGSLMRNETQASVPFTALAYSTMKDDQEATRRWFWVIAGGAEFARSYEGRVQ